MLELPRNKTELDKIAETFKASHKCEDADDNLLVASTMLLDEEGNPVGFSTVSTTSGKVRKAYDIALREDQLGMSESEAKKVPVHERGLLMTVEQAFRQAGLEPRKGEGEGDDKEEEGEARIKVFLVLAGGTSKSAYVQSKLHELAERFGAEVVLPAHQEGTGDFYANR